MCKGPEEEKYVVGMRVSDKWPERSEVAKRGGAEQT